MKINFNNDCKYQPSFKAARIRLARPNVPYVNNFLNELENDCRYVAAKSMATSKLVIDGELTIPGRQSPYVVTIQKPAVATPEHLILVPFDSLDDIKKKAETLIKIIEEAPKDYRTNLGSNSLLSGFGNLLAAIFPFMR